MMISVNTVELKSPPTMGAAILFITREPVSVMSITGTRAKRVVATVMSLGRTLITAPSTMTS